MGVPVKDYEDYIIFEDGMIFSYKTNKFLKFNANKAGYLSVELFNNNGSKRLLVHRLVAEAFIPNPNNYPQVNHIDECVNNNSVTNLEWCTAKYNMNYGNGALTRHSKIDYSKPYYRDNAIKNGKKVSLAVIQMDRNGDTIQIFKSIRDASNKSRTNSSHISECAKGKRKSAGGYVWKYERGNDLSEFQY